MPASNHFNGPLHFGDVSPIVCTTTIRCQSRPEHHKTFHFVGCYSFLQENILLHRYLNLGNSPNKRGIRITDVDQMAMEKNF